MSDRYPAAAPPGTASMRPTKARFVILALIAIGTTINYLDRSVVGIAAPSMTAELGLSAALMGVIFSAFSWTYTLSQIPAGILLDRDLSPFFPPLKSRVRGCRHADRDGVFRFGRAPFFRPGRGSSRRRAQSGSSLATGHRRRRRVAGLSQASTAAT